MDHRIPETPKRPKPGASSVLIYLAGPLFSEAERRFNLALTEILEARGFRVFLPQRDGVERGRPPYDAMTPEERRQAMFELDRQQVLEADVFLIVLDGRVPDEGACVELGMAHCQKHLQDREAPRRSSHGHPCGLHRLQAKPDGARPARLHSRRREDVAADTIPAHGVDERPGPPQARRGEA